jgi:hypothetical protein
MRTTLRALIAAGVVVASFGLAVAKLPPLTDEQKAAATAKKEKDAEVAKKDAADLAQAHRRPRRRRRRKRKRKLRRRTPPTLPRRRIASRPNISPTKRPRARR